MADIYSKDKRTEVMRSVRSKGNKSTELKLIQFFKNSHVVGWKRNYPVIGHPDFIFPKHKVAIFVDGCFWHGHNCRNLTPNNNYDYWVNKIENNKKHDSEITKLFLDRGWTVVRIWECELKKKNKSDLKRKIYEALNLGEKT